MSKQALANKMIDQGATNAELIDALGLHNHKEQVYAYKNRAKRFKANGNYKDPIHKGSTKRKYMTKAVKKAVAVKPIPKSKQTYAAVVVAPEPKTKSSSIKLIMGTPSEIAQLLKDL